MKSKHVIELVAVVVFVGVLAFYVTRAEPTPLTSKVGDKPTVAGGDMNLDPISKSSPITATSMGNAPASTPSVQSPTDPNGNQWVNGVDATGKSLGVVEVDKNGNYLVSASKGPASGSLKGRAHF